MAEELCTGWFRIVVGSLEVEECKSAIMMEGLKKRTRKAFGIRKKEKGDKDNDSTGSPDRDGGSQKKANGAAVNGFSGEIDWDRYNTPTVDDEGYSLRPDEEEGPGSAGPKPPKEHFFSSSESEGEEDHRKKFKIKIKPLPSESANCLAPSVDELKASIGNIALSPSPLRSSPRRSPGLMNKDCSEEIQVARPRRSAPIAAPTLAAPVLQAPRSKKSPAVPLPEKEPAPGPAPVPEDATALFGPPLETAFREQKTEVGISEQVVCDVWGAPLPESESLSPDFSFTRTFSTGTPPPLLPKNVPTSPPPTSSPSADAAELSVSTEGSERKTSIPNLDNIFGPAEPSAFGEESADKWVCFSEELAASERPPPPKDPAPPLSTSPAPPEDPPASPVPTSPLPSEDPSPSLPPLPTSPPPQEEPFSSLPTSETPTEEPALRLPTVPPVPKDPTPPPTPLPPKDHTPHPTPLPTIVPPLDPPPSIAPVPPIPSPPSVAPVPPAVPSPPKARTPVSPTSPPGHAIVDEPSRTIAPPLVFVEEERKNPEGAAPPVPPAPSNEGLVETAASPKAVGQVSRAAPPPPPPPTYRAVVSSPGPTTEGMGSGASSPARPATPSAPSAVFSSPTPPPPPPRPTSRPKLPPGKPSKGDMSRPFSPPGSHSSSPPSIAPVALARAESTSSISSNNSLSAATTPTVGKNLTLSVSEDDAFVDKLPTFGRPFDSLAENDQPSLVWFDRGKFYLTFEGCSRGPSPLTMGAQDTLPVAAAFTETVNAFFKGANPNKCVVKITGEMVLSFPAGITRHFANNPSPAVLTFSITHYSWLEHVLPNPQLLCCDTATTPNPDCKTFWVNMPNLMTHLKKVAEQKPQATYYNVDMLKYQVSAQGLTSTPLNLAASWRCEPTSTDLRIDYKYNGGSMTTPVALNNVQFLIPVDGGVTKLLAVLPPAAWNAEQQRILWKIPDISQKSENGGIGSLLARFQLSEGPSKPSPLAVQFTSEGSTLSGCDIELAGPGYRFSLIKKRFAAGKYLADN
ncbi:SH3-containing GRB2-like protein 3-interacting protein 1 isoform X13 [Salvelinus fontinalis]|uniref:SH3-containing GRB2-like protein 3-interacting protein 1 isoform X13 n=1 Tax=Salvelinus fontinalis TaxID=8038 RepID=UPI002486C02F|nr:SH3-containing GRB2-like protein 3-interacting protein 1 isoform X13 [Salvelinus fontinalis]